MIVSAEIRVGDDECMAGIMKDEKHQCLAVTTRSDKSSVDATFRMMIDVLNTIRLEHMRGET